ncbi:tetratricopeptide (TPR) repeat protein [Streptomyces sp. V1I1]|nr:tetratricopeptide (TPR) repeat protein [Streptomyces sp. V1I1]
MKERDRGAHRGSDAVGWHRGRGPGSGLLLERESELHAVTDALANLCGQKAARSNGGGLVVFTGAAGLGKTSMLAEVRRIALERGCGALFARGGEQEEGLAFHVVRRLLQPALAALSEVERRELLGAWYEIVGPALGLFAAPDDVAHGKDGEKAALPDPQGVRDGLDWVVTRLAMRDAPLVLIVDDAHWADGESLAWLASFVSKVEDLPLLMVLAYRPDQLSEEAEGLRRMAGRNGVRPLGLAALTQEAVAELLRRELGEDAEYGFCRECWVVTGGNPYEAVELTAKVLERGILPTEENSPLLHDLAAAVKGSGLVARLRRMGPTAVRLAWAVALLGTEAPPQLAANIASLGPAEVTDAADRLRAGRILTGSDTLEFVHPLIATAVYRAIPGAVRVAMHGQAAWALLDAGQGPVAAARHLLETQPERDPAVVKHLRDAARAYLRAGAPDAARRCLGRALQEPPPADVRAAVLYELGCSSLLHSPVATVNHLQSALEEPQVTPALREGITLRLAQVLAHTDRLAEAAETVAKEAREAVDSRARLRMQAWHFIWSAFRVDEPDSAARSRRLARLADRLTGRDLTERYILGLRAWDAMVRGERADNVVDYAERALRDGMSWTDPDWGFEVPVLVALTFMYCDRPHRTEELFAAGIAEFEAAGWRGAHLSYGYALLGYVRYRRGRLAEAEDFARKGLDVAERVGEGVSARCNAVAILIEVLLAKGEIAAAQELAESHAFGDDFPRAMMFPPPQAVHGELRLAQGRTREAAMDLAAAGRRLTAREMINPTLSPWLGHLALAEAEEDLEKARDLALQEADRAERAGIASQVGMALRVAASLTEGPEGLRLLERAVACLEQSPAAYEYARALADQGSALRRAGRIEECAEQLYLAMDLAAQCGAEALATTASRELAGLGLRPRRLRGDTAAESLNQEERKAAERAALGSSNELIAEELRMDDTQVARLLSSVYRKVGTDRAGLRRALRLPAPRSLSLVPSRADPAGPQAFGPGAGKRGEG